MSTTTRADALFEQADRQIIALTALLAGQEDALLARPCPGRERLGDGTIGAVALHTVENYGRIVAFVQGVAGHDEAGHGHGHGHGGHLRAANARLDELGDQLDAVSQALRFIVTLSDQRLDVVPPAGEMRFADGQRTLEQIVTSVLRHQRHQLDALQAAVA